MSRLSIFPDQASPAEHGAAADLITEDLSTIQRELNKRGIGFERWTASIELAAEADEASILGSYAEDVNRVKQAHGFVTVDAIRMTPEHPERIALRNKFLSEHTHSEDEVRFFVEGRGLFNLHIKDEVLSVLCERGDLIHVPAGTKHWFDMGSRPQFCALVGWLTSATTQSPSAFPGWTESNGGSRCILVPNGAGAYGFSGSPS